MATTKITHKELEELVREMVNSMVNEMPGEAPIMEKKLTPAEKKKKEELVMALKKKYGKTPKTYAIATDMAKKLAEDETNESKAKFTDKYDDSPKLKGGQKNLPDQLQKAIIGKSQDEELDERSMAFPYFKSKLRRHQDDETYKKGHHSLEEEKIMELEKRRKAIIKKLEELEFGSPRTAEPEIETDTEEEEIIATPPPRPGRPNPFRREEFDTEVIPDMEPQGRLEDVVRRYMRMKK